MTDDESALAAELRALGREIATPDPGDRITTAVMERIAAEPAPAWPRWPAVTRLLTGLRRHARATLAALLVLLAGLALTPPVRAAVADLFNFGGVVVRPGPVVPSAPPAPTVPARVTLAEAERLVGFRPAVPRKLGPPQGVVVSADHRIVSMSWRRGPNGQVRIDQFDGRLAPGFVKEVYLEARDTEVSGRPALWFPRPHRLVLLDEHGAERAEAARSTGPTLVWELNGTTLRLEGVRSMTTAIEIAESA
jgi:hypothetical protein